ncbi:hypothetical protein SKAU_G00345090 [Synaphobranchus kaupii]|uniref:Uncharacterized protein n=1 Tax=Synaphobranchus kaupii TaxID=118154 RepID=A0A9Q1EJB5_SYNKA|nr:hypothetical protein SKAU_G00345090 [Synaphobranchus kaupii]
MKIIFCICLLSVTVCRSYGKSEQLSAVVQGKVTFPATVKKMGSWCTKAFSGTVVEKDPGLPSSIPHLTIAPPALPTILERKCEDPALEGPQGPPKRVSKFKASRVKVTM